MYALIVRNNQDLWDVWETVPTIPFPEREERLQAAIKSNYPIIGKNLTEYKTSAKSGAVWDGEKFSGGEMKIEILENEEMSVYGYICNDVIVLLRLKEPGTEFDDLCKAIFESETTVINIPEGQTAKAGDLWDGTNIIKRYYTEGEFYNV
jgi:hypothetical protein